MTVEEKKIHYCENCNKKDVNLRCNRCKNTYYCSKECQVKNWKSHKLSCKNSNSKKEEKEDDDTVIFNKDDKSLDEIFVPQNNEPEKVWDQGSNYYLNKKYRLTLEAYVHAIYLDSTLTLRCKPGENVLRQLFKRFLHMDWKDFPLSEEEKFDDHYLNHPLAGILFLYTFCKKYTGSYGFLVCATKLAEKYSDNAYVQLFRGRVFGEMTALLRQKDAMKESRGTLKTQITCLERAYDLFSKKTYTVKVPLVQKKEEKEEKKVNEEVEEEEEEKIKEVTDEEAEKIIKEKEGKTEKVEKEEEEKEEEEEVKIEERKFCLFPIIYELGFAYRDVGRIADSLEWYNRFLKEAPVNHHARMKTKSAISFLEKARAHFGDVYVPED